MSESAPLPPGATIGILGGGQLGRMLSVAAGRLGYKVHIFEPAEGPPAGDLAHAVTTASYQDRAALVSFARASDVVSYEFENIPPSALDIIEAEGRAIRPSRRALETTQNRVVEKEFLRSLAIETAPFAPVSDLSSLMAALDQIGTPAILKTQSLGYDGKGQARINSPDEAEAALKAMAGAASVLEGFVDFSAEISVIAARGASGEIVCYDPGHNVHEDGILRTTEVPANIPARLRSDAVLIGAKILNALEYVGVLGVELFVTPGGLIANEIAPRVHNSGHWTQNGCAIDQFEQHIRAIAGLPLGDGSRVANVTMHNLIGSDVDDLPRLLACGGSVHLYGKIETRPGRKMGHINYVTKTA